MSGGFPNRPNRTDFGPAYEDARPTRNPKRNATAAVFSLSCFQVAGLSGMSPLAWLTGNIVAGPDVELGAHAESWNPNGETTGDYAPPMLARTGVGLYTYTYPAEVPNDDGELVALDLSWGIAVARDTEGGTTLSQGYVRRLTAVTGEIKIVSMNLPSTIALADVPFALLLF